MRLDRAGRLAWVLCAGIVAGCTCGRGEGTGGSGPLAEDDARVGGGGGRRVALEITEAFTKTTGQTAPRTSFLSPEEEITVRARLVNAPNGAEDHIRWTVRPVGAHTGPAIPATHEGKEFTFRGSSANGNAGSRQPNPPLEYEVIATATVEGQTLEARLPPTTFIRQEEVDIVRQEYADYGTSFRPRLTQISVPGRALLNTGNYTFIVEEDEGKLEELLTQVEQEVNRILNDDVQEQPVRTRGLKPNTVVVSPGPPVLEAGPLGDTDPQGDDVCVGPRVNGACSGPILAGRNGVAETLANNRQVRVELSKLVTSAYRNPQRNRVIGSRSLNSRHTRGRALDLDPRALTVRGKDARQLMCVMEAAGDRVVGTGNSFTERGAATFLDCNDVAADHVHIQR
ncbi:D-Ala-D-Ala carboxypeptidase family metallohydrolase [Hyalangium gracile]|uniref:D-Ala-D-Ala carboxypeptidase family metallohydrolase n=1 Tax=Hyalangium gracile TaxID=394092 RepID=UPI001CCE7EB9|nr:D-Ala-D-Ala carboxypeptidase family metallohydrolase [Hyalangium gracile]